MIVDTTVQEKNITYPTDLKLYNKLIKRVWQLAAKTGIKLRQSYKRTVKKINALQRFCKSRLEQTRTQAIRGQRKLKTLAGRLLRDLTRKLPQALKTDYESFLALSDRLLKQKRTDRDKLYSLHEPSVSCISKGKVNKKYEFGSKVSVVVSKVDNVVLGVSSFRGNPYDSHTLSASLSQATSLTGGPIKKAIVDRGYQGVKQVGDSQIIGPKSNHESSKKSRLRYRQYFRRRAAVEGIISHMKHGYGMGRNYLKGELGDQVNCILSGVGFNLRSYLRKLSLELKRIIYVLLKASLAGMLPAVCYNKTKPISPF